MLCPKTADPNGSSAIQLADLLKKQRMILQGRDARVHRHMPKVVREAIEVLRNLIRESRRMEQNAADGAYGSLEDSILKP